MRDHPQPSVLIVGGSAEARALRRRLGAGAHWHLPAEGRTGPGAVGTLRSLEPSALAALGLGAVIEAAHPCDVATARAAAAAARALDLPHLQLVRPPWAPGPLDRWHRIDRAGQAARLLPEGARLFAASGREDLAAVSRLRARVYLRLLDPPRETGRGRVRFVPGHPPFTAESEARLFRRLGIDLLLLRNAGGRGGWPKLAAARALGLPVAMIARPARPAGPRATTPEEALQWLATLIPSDA